MTRWSELNDAANAIVSQDFDELAQFVMRHHDVPVCECERCNELTHHDETRCVDESYSWCDSCVSDAAYYHESDGEYHSEPEPSSDEYPVYHSSTLRPGFRGAIGIELELQFHDEPCDVIDAADQHDVNLEQDSSLTRENSAEVITHPFRADRAGLKALGGLTAFLDAVRCGGWGRRDYGIHVNLDRGKFSNFDVLRATQFIKNNANEVARVAGRDRIYSGDTFARTFIDRVAIGKRGYCPKYSPIHIDGRRVEFRIYQANAKAEGVRQCVRFSRDVMEFARRAGYRGLTWSAFIVEFPRWANYRKADINAVSA
jgi:hypothetical protein